MDGIFQKKGKEMLKKGKIFKNLAKMYKIWKYFEKGQAIAFDHCTQQTAGIGQTRSHSQGLVISKVTYFV